MAEYAVIGGQWGDEGKGKIVDWLAENEKVKYVVRFNGGNNAGHTVWVGSDEYKFHLLPSGILHPEIVNVIGNGVVIDPSVLVGELDSIESRGHKVNLRISESANLIMPYHRVLDGIEGGKIGTTGRGIGPCYEDKVARRGITVHDLMNDGVFREKLLKNMEMKNQILTKIYDQKPLSTDEIFDSYSALSERFRQYVCDVSLILYEAKCKDENILFEGAQGTMLDVDHGTKPYTTSSNPTIGGIFTGTGIRPNLDTVLGVMKAYTTRVGGGPFPTELNDETGKKIQEIGKEVGTTTGRNRRCGWLDTVIGRYASRINGFDELAITKLDVLGFLPVIKVCTAYNYNNKEIKEISSGINLEECSPVYEEWPGWREDISNIRNYRDLPENTKRYLSRIEELTETPVSIISVGPEREQTILK